MLSNNNWSFKKWQFIVSLIIIFVSWLCHLKHHNLYNKSAELRLTWLHHETKLMILHLFVYYNIDRFFYCISKMKLNREVSNTFYNWQLKSPGLSKWFRLQGELMTVDALTICLCIFFLFYWGAAKTISVLGYRQSQVHFDNQKVLSRYWVTKHLLLWVQALLHLCQKFLQLTPFLDIAGAMQPFFTDHHPLWMDLFSSSWWT